jgi:NADH:flavin oxidoreductase / NADH oxidase family
MPQHRNAGEREFMTSPGASQPLLFTPITLRGVTAPNRIVVSPVCQYVSVDGGPTDWQFVHFGRYAMGGAGIVFGEEHGRSAGVLSLAVMPGAPVTHGCHSRESGNPEPPPNEGWGAAAVAVLFAWVPRVRGHDDVILVAVGLGKPWTECCPTPRVMLM